LEDIYKKLEIKGFEEAKKNFEELIESQKDYKTNQYNISENFKNKIKNQCREIFEEYGYEM